MAQPNILVTGITGCIGRHLAEYLSAQGLSVRGMGRGAAAPPKLAGQIEYQQADVSQPETLVPALAGIDVAYYLIHSMGDHEDYQAQDRVAAQAFVDAAVAANVRRVVYLSGLGRGEGLSKHLLSRQEVGRILASNPQLECIEFRAAVVISEDSLSFRIIQQLTERLPVMLCPRWVETETQPIALDDVLKYLDRARQCPAAGSHVLEIGGADVVTYGDMIREYARQRGLRRLLIPLPLLTPNLSGLWLGLVTPASSSVGRHLVEGLKNRTVVESPRAEETMKVHPMGVPDAIRRALHKSA